MELLNVPFETEPFLQPHIRLPSDHTEEPRETLETISVIASSTGACINNGVGKNTREYVWSNRLLAISLAQASSWLMTKEDITRAELHKA